MKQSDKKQTKIIPKINRSKEFINNPLFDQTFNYSIYHVIKYPDNKSQPQVKYLNTVPLYDRRKDYNYRTSEQKNYC